MDHQPLIAAREVFEAAEAHNRKVGHENAGFLSADHGFLPLEPPLQALPSPYDEWDGVAAQLPELFRSLRLRQVLDGLPELSFSPSDLPDSYLLRASSMVGILAHSYMRVEANPASALPPVLQKAWDTLALRLERPTALLSYIDLILYNWKLDPASNPGDHRNRTVENMDLLFPTVGNEEERIFYLTQVEIAAVSSPLVTAVIRAEEAAVRDDPGALESELLNIMSALQHMSNVSVRKIDPNRRSATHVDQVVWAKTVAPFAVPVQPGQPGPSGTAAPLFHFMDAFLSRPSYEAALGQEATKLAAISPRHWREFIGAVGQVSIRDYIARTEYEPLKDLFNLVLDAYAGDKGYLGVHRLKAYGFLEVAFKAGRSVTIGGFKGLFQDKTWNQIDAELGHTRDERYIGLSPRPFVLHPVPSNRGSASVALDKRGLVYQPGDRVGIWPENDPDLVERTLASLRATGSEPIPLSRAWRSAIRQRPAYPPDSETLPLGDLLRFARLRPVTRSVLKTLYNLTAAHRLEETLTQRLEDQLELWDVLEALAETGFDPRHLWKAEPLGGAPHHPAGPAGSAPPLLDCLRSGGERRAPPEHRFSRVRIGGNAALRSTHSPTARLPLPPPGDAAFGGAGPDLAQAGPGAEVSPSGRPDSPDSHVRRRVGDRAVPGLLRRPAARDGRRAERTGCSTASVSSKISRVAT